MGVLLFKGSVGVGMLKWQTSGFPSRSGGNRERRAYSVPPACRGNLKEGVLVYPYFCELWLSDWHNLPRTRGRNRDSLPACGEGWGLKG
jgi:hypothetical protein